MPGLHSALREVTERRFDTYVAELADLVAIDSGTDDHAGVARAADRFAGLLESRGYGVARPAVRAGVPPVVGTLRGTGTARLVLSGHLDTVFDAGTAAARPFAVANGRASGPGVSDDKGGLLAGLFALDALREVGFEDFAEITLLATTDEETGSTAARDLIVEVAATHDVGLCLECAREDGSLVIARAGVADVVLEVRGRAAHAGIEPERGVNAAVAASALAVEIHALNGRWDDVTVNVGVISGGSRANVVPDRARLVVDLRSRSSERFAAALDAVAQIAARPPYGAAVQLSVENDAPPWEADARSRAVGARAVALGRALGMSLQLVETGGSADANLLAAAGLPVLDGLGPVGGADHSVDEWLDLSTAVDRIALLAVLIADLSSPDATAVRASPAHEATPR
ncbi:M20/M25/M40 family metallo-hydrolase [Nocardioides sp. MAH-18]|uniref:M20/M25/M40 family metallo-hydrolase n=1 Tax=Nocardioides agri TaxID=2682843 RepID=A0A6L6XTK8_9ACTN|nr:MULTISPECIES: M20/M25/M40 family metallo-hydrolase [unclassified Nocardioides]MBA2955488.1 M20/M25/M40 family metallo-hydrolase [Nocardioides sp. CGMCC 1.13656]MVQ50338.1 M20/M25/M40 family metallo-hydrolase [Nocardioides sp. MAH-18]